LHPGIARVLEFASLPESVLDERFSPDAPLARYPIELTRLEDFIVARAKEATVRAVVQARPR
jgi:hypothetical protein